MSDVNFGSVALGLTAIALSGRRADKFAEERMGMQRGGLEFGVELAGHKPRMARQLDQLHQPAVGRKAAQSHSGLLERLTKAR